MKRANDAISEDGSTDDSIDLLATFIILTFKKEPVKQHDSILTGNEYYLELMRTPNEARFHDATRMDRHSFMILLNLLTERGGLKDSNRTVFISAGQS